MSKLLLLDKDDTLVTPASGEKFVQTPWDQKPIPRMLEKVSIYQGYGWETAIISNQGGIAARHKTLANTFQEMRFCLELFGIEEAYFCPDFEGKFCWRCWNTCTEEDRIFYDETHPDVNCLNLAGHFRKPQRGMLRLAAHLYGADEVLYVGDRPEDQAAAEAMGVKFMFPADFLSS